MNLESLHFLVNMSLKINPTTYNALLAASLGMGMVGGMALPFVTSVLTRDTSTLPTPNELNNDILKDEQKLEDITERLDELEQNMLKKGADTDAVRKKIVDLVDVLCQEIAHGVDDNKEEIENHKQVLLEATEHIYQQLSDLKQEVEKNAMKTHANAECIEKLGTQVASTGLKISQLMNESKQLSNFVVNNITYSAEKLKEVVQEIKDRADALEVELKNCVNVLEENYLTSTIDAKENRILNEEQAARLNEEIKATKVRLASVHQFMDALQKRMQERIAKNEERIAENEERTDGLENTTAANAATIGQNAARAAARAAELQENLSMVEKALKNQTDLDAQKIKSLEEEQEKIRKEQEKIRQEQKDLALRGGSSGKNKKKIQQTEIVFAHGECTIFNNVVLVILDSKQFNFF